MDEDNEDDNDSNFTDIIEPEFDEYDEENDTPSPIPQEEEGMMIDIPTME